MELSVSHIVLFCIVLYFLHCNVRVGRSSGSHGYGRRTTTRKNTTDSKYYYDPSDYKKKEAHSGPTIQRRKCFAEGTRILTPNGSTRIENLKVGDGILSVDQAGIMSNDVVAYVHHPKNSVSAEFKNIKLSNDTTLCVTSDHLVNVGTIDKLKPARDICIGDKLISPLGNLLTVVGLSDATLQGVYDILPRKNPFFVANGVVVSPQCVNSPVMSVLHYCNVVPHVTQILGRLAAVAV